MAPTALNPQTKFILDLINSLSFPYKDFLWVESKLVGLNKRETNEEEIELDLSDCDDSKKTEKNEKTDLEELRKTFG